MLERIASCLISELFDLKTFYLQGAYEDYVWARSQKSYELDTKRGILQQRPWIGLNNKS